MSQDLPRSKSSKSSKSSSAKGSGAVREQGYSGSQAASIVGISYRQLDYWARTDLIRPGISDARGSGSRRHYSYRNLLELRMIKNLLDAGIRLEAIREVFDYLRANSDEAITSAHLVISGSSVVLCRGEDLLDVVRKGQGVLNLLPLAQVKEQIDDRLIALFSDDVDVIGADPTVDSRVQVPDESADGVRRRTHRAS